MSDTPKTSKPTVDPQLALARARSEKEKFYAAVQWYAVYVHPQHEFQVHDYLMGVEDEGKKIHRGKAKREDLFIKIDPAKVRMECYVPVIRQRVKYSDRYVWKEKIQTPGLVFVKTTLNNRDPLFHSPISEHVTGFLSDREKHRPVPIPDAQMELFQKLVEAEYAVSVDRPTFCVGQKVLIVEGAMAGHIAELMSMEETISRKEYEKDRMGKTVVDAEGNPVPKHKTMLCLKLNSLLAATFEIDADKVAPAPDNARDFEAQD